MTRNMTLSVGLVVLLAACGSDSPSPLAPTPTPTPTPTPVSQVAVNYAGTWSGRYTVTDCRQTKGFDERFCETMFTYWDSPIELTIVQRGSDVTGSFLLGFDPGSHSGVVDTGGQLRLTARIDGVYNIDVTNWKTMMSGSEMVGTFTQEWRSSDGSAGTGQVDCILTTVTKRVAGQQ